STGVLAMKMPLRPPMTNIDTKPSANSIGTLNCNPPPHTVPSQLNVLIAEGTAMTMVVTVKAMPSFGFIPLTNMWWPYTIQDRNAMPIMENAMAWERKIGLGEHTRRISGGL